MPYSKPDVFVSVEIPVASPNITIPSLLPCMVGEMYFVKRDEFVADVTGSETTTFSYRNLPQSTQHPATRLAVDVEGDFAPRFEVVTEDGGRVDVSSDFDATPTGFSIKANANVPAGALYVSYRARDDKYSDAAVTAATFEDLVAFFGADALGPANPLGYAMYSALTHGQVAVAGLAVTNLPDSSGLGQYGPLTDLPAAYSQAFSILQRHDVYAIVPLTHNAFVMDLALAHARSMSSHTGKSERRVFFVPDMGADVAIRGGASFEPWYLFEDDSGNAIETLMASVQVGDIVDFHGYSVIKAASDTFYVKGLAPGLVTIGSDDFDVSAGPTMLVELDSSAVQPHARRVKASDTFGVSVAGSKVEMPILQVGAAGNERMVKVDTTSANGVVGGPYKFYRSVNPVTQRSEYVAAYKQLARSYSDERLVLVGPEWVGGANDADVPAYFAAAGLAAEVCLVGRQPAGAAPGVNPISGFRDSVDHLFRSSRYFTESEMDEIGGAGWTILVNPRAGMGINTRHTVTTDMSSIETGELILGVERDFLSRTFREELRKDIRQFRIDDQTIAATAVKADAVAKMLTMAGSPARSFRAIDIVEVAQDEDERDAISIVLDATQLYPFNKGKVRVKIVV